MVRMSSGLLRYNDLMPMQESFSLRSFASWWGSLSLRLSSVKRSDLIALGSCLPGDDCSGLERTVCYVGWHAAVKMS